MPIATAVNLCQNHFMTVSLIIPAFNEEKYLPHLFESILAQSHPPDEIIVCDNASTDNTTKVIKNYAKRLPLKLIYQPQKGIRYAVESCWRQSSGDIILRTDADCILPPDWVKNMLAHFTQDPHLAAAGGYFHASDKQIFFKLFTLPATIFNSISLRLTRGFWVLYGANFAIRRQVMVSINGYATNLSGLQDDILLSQKLHQHHYKYLIFPDCWNYTSTRRLHSPKSAILAFLSGFASRFYIEKST